MSVFKFRDADGNVREILALKGEKGEKGDPGELLHTDADGEVLEKVFVQIIPPVLTATPTTLGAVMSSAQAGATIQLSAGNYERLDLVGANAYPEGLTIVGGEGVTMAGVSITSGLAKLETVTDINPQMQMPSDLTFKGLTFTNSFCLRNCVIDGLNILDCGITEGNISLSPDSLVDQYGRDVADDITAPTVWQWNSAKPHIQNVVIDNNIIYDASADSKTSGIVVSCVDNLELTNNEIQYAAFNGIQVNGQSGHYSTGKIAISYNTISKSGSRSIRIAGLKNAELFVYYNMLSYANQTDANEECIKVSDCKNTTYRWLLGTDGENLYDGEKISVGNGITLENCTGIHAERTEHPGCYYRTVDGVTEWVNPPMLPGVEYRTTEQYNGKTVYTMLVDCGLWTDGKHIIVNLGQMVTVIDSFGEVYGDVLAPITGDVSGTKICSYKITPADTGLGITLVNGSNDNANYDLQTYITIKYIKYHPMGG